MAETIVIWNKTNNKTPLFFAREVLTQIDSEKEDNSIKVFHTHEDFFDSESEIQEDVLSSLTGAHFIIVLAELAWNNKNYADFYGLELVQAMREADIKNPIVVCSFMPLNKLLEKKDTKFQLLNTPGVFYYRLPSGKINHNKINPFQPLTQNLLEDIKYYIFTDSGRIDELFHDIKNQLGFSTVEINERKLAELKPVIDSFFNDIGSILSDDASSELEEIKNLYFKEIEGQEIIPSQILYRYKPKVARLISGHKKDKEEQKEKQYELPWLILYIEDNQETLQTVETNFKQLGIGCIPASNGVDAIEILQKDSHGELNYEGKLYPPNSITVLITDWRLKDENNKWFYLQGYDIINEIFLNHKNLLSFFVLTTKKGGILKKVQNLSPVQISWYAKEDVMDSAGSFNLFAAKVVEQGNEIFNSIIYKPGVPAWSSKPCHRAPVPLAEYYRQFRLSSEHKKMNDEISELAVDFFEQAVTIKEYYDTGTTLQVDSEIAPTAQMKTSDLDNEWIVFRDRMVARRIALALYRLEEWDNVDISSVLLSKELGGDINKPLFTEALCISASLSKNFGDRILREEAIWFEDKFGHTINFINDALRKKLKSIFTNFATGFNKAIGHNREKRLKYLEKYPFLFEYIEPGEVDYIKNFISAVHQIENSGMEFQDLTRRFSTQMKALLKNKFNMSFFEKFEIII